MHLQVAQAGVALPSLAALGYPPLVAPIATTARAQQSIGTADTHSSFIKPASSAVQMESRNSKALSQSIDLETARAFGTGAIVSSNSSSDSSHTLLLWISSSFFSLPNCDFSLHLAQLLSWVGDSVLSFVSLAVAAGGTSGERA